MSALITVRLLKVPVAVQLRAAAHHDALVREFQVIRAGASDPDAIPTRLTTLIDDVTGRYASFGDSQREVFMAAVEEGRTELDLEVAVPPEIGPALVQIVGLLDEADEYCRAGEHLLTLAMPPDASAYRRWFLRQFVDQVAGAEPVSWPDYLASHPLAEPAPTASPVAREPVPEGDADSPPRWRTVGPKERPTLVIDGSLDLNTASELRDAIQDLRAGGAETLMVDLRQVGFVDSVALSVLVAANRRFVEEGASMSLFVPDRMMRLLQIAGLDDVLSVSNAE